MNICKDIDCKANFCEESMEYFKNGVCSKLCDRAIVDKEHSECCYICSNLTQECRIMSKESELAILMKAVKIRKYMTNNKKGKTNANISQIK